jgi:tetratricopeptide (TPR) repeat protein
MTRLIAVLLLIACGAAASNAQSGEDLRALAAAGDATELAKLETALAQHPDDLRSGCEYRQAVIKAKAYDRCLKFFERLVTDHPDAAYAHLNYGLAYLDKVPDSGAITQLILANSALPEFTKAIELRPNFLTYYMRGASYVYWPRVFNRTPLGIEDLEKALKVMRPDKNRSYYVYLYIALGDGYWKMESLPKAKEIWGEGLKFFPNDADLKGRLSRGGDDLKAFISETRDPTKRFDTSLKEAWGDP